MSDAQLECGYRLCSEPLTYSGRGRRPKYCQQKHKKAEFDARKKVKREEQRRIDRAAYAAKLQREQEDRRALEVVRRELMLMVKPIEDLLIHLTGGSCRIYSYGPPAELMHRRGINDLLDLLEEEEWIPRSELRLPEVAEDAPEAPKSEADAV